MSSMWQQSYAENLRRAVQELGLRPGDRVLMLRCAHQRLVAPLLDAVCAAHPEVTIDLLTQEHFLPHLKHPAVQPLVIAEGELELELLGQDVRQTLAARDYRIGLVPFGTRRGENYDNVRALLPSLAPCPFVGVGNDGQGIKLVAGAPFLKDDGRLSALHNKYEGRRAFIIGNGPSLTISDLKRLKGELCFASNKIYLAFEQTDWRPDYYNVDDALLAENNAEEIRRQRLPKIFNLLVRAYFEGDDEIVYFNERPNPTRNGKCDFQFATDAPSGLYSGCTVVYKQLQLAYYFGVREVYLLGLDFYFKTPPSTGKWAVNSEVLVNAAEQNHFHPDYRKPGETWTQPQLEHQRAAFICAREAFAAAGGVVYNASRQTALDVFPRIDFDQVAPETQAGKPGD